MSREDLLDGLSVAATQGQVRQIRHEHLHTAYWQPRRTFYRESLLALARSIRYEGVRQNLIVRPSPYLDGKYEIIAGERRWRASAPDLSDKLHLTLEEEASLVGSPPPTLPCLILTLDMQDARRLSAVENLQREDLDPVDEAVYRLLLIQDVLTADDPEEPEDGEQHTTEERDDELATMASTLGRQLHAMRNHPEQYEAETARLQKLFESLGTMTWESFVTNNLPLLQLPPHLLKAVRTGEMAGRSALLIHRQTNPAVRQTLLDASTSGASFQDLRRILDDHQGHRWKGLAADVRRRLGARSLDRLDTSRRERVVRLLEQLDAELQERTPVGSQTSADE